MLGDDIFSKFSVAKLGHPEIRKEMTGQLNSLILEPSYELTFYPPFTPGCQSSLAVTNTTPFTVYFKLKTTASLRYCVKPKIGAIPPSGRVSINFKLVVPVTDSSLTEDDKFKLVYFEHASDDADDPEKAWERFGETSARSIKIPVFFTDEPPLNSRIDSGLDGAGENSVVDRVEGKIRGVEGKIKGVEGKSKSVEGGHCSSTVFDASSIMSWLKLLTFVIIGGLAAYVAQVVDLKASKSIYY